MGLLDDAKTGLRHWWQDQRTDDPDIQAAGNAKSAIRRLEQALPKLSAEDRADQINWLKAYTDKYYLKHQGEERVPEREMQRLERLAKEAERLDRVDRAEMILRKYGGPPTPETLQAAIERSQVALRPRTETPDKASLSYSEPLRVRTEAPEKAALSYSEPLRQRAEAVKETVQPSPRPTVSLESYVTVAESLRGNRVNNERLSKAIGGLTVEQIEQRIKQLEPSVGGPDKVHRGVEREMDLLKMAREVRREEPIAFDYDAWKAAKQATPQQVVQQLKAVHKEWHDGIKAGLPPEKMEAIAARDNAIRQARPEVVKQAMSEAQKVQQPKVAVSF